MRGGTLDRKAVIQQLAVTRDAALSGEVKAWSTFADVWVGVKDGGGRESITGNQTVALRTARVTMRYLSGVTETMRVVVDGRTLEIKSKAEIGRREGWLLTCEEIDGN